MYKKPGLAVILALAVLGFSNSVAFAIPDYLDLYLNDYYATNASQNCGLCHQNPNGGGARNSFGQEFEKSHVRSAVVRAVGPGVF